MSLLPSKPTPKTPEPDNIQANTTTFEDRLVRISEVCYKVGLGKTTIYKLMNDGRFPLPVCFTAKLNTWRLSDINAYIKGEFAPALEPPEPQATKRSKRGKSV